MNQRAIRIDLQLESTATTIPQQALFERWVGAALRQNYARLEQTIRIVDEDEMQQLNRDYRGFDKPTNVLSFPTETVHGLDYTLLGDLVICAPVIECEARAQGKQVEAHWAHMVVHGMLHLQGFDHDTDGQAAEMEALEIEIMAGLGHTNPYLID